MRNILAALVYLRATSLRNLVVSRLARLKQPKYLIGAVIGVGYLFLVFGGRFRGDRPSRLRAVGSAIPADILPTIEVLSAAVLLLFFLLCWVWPRNRASLAFTEAEIAFLFPAPLSRRTLVHYRLINTQLRLIFTSLIFAFLSGRWGFAVDSFLVRLLAWWLVFSTIWLHTMGSSFAITQLLDRGVTSLRRQFAVVAAVVLSIAASSVWTWNEWRAPTTDDTTDVASILNYIVTMLQTGALGLLLTPVQWLLGPLFARDAGSYVYAMGPALLVYAAHYIWVVRSDTSFEDASIARAQKRAAKVAAMREGKFQIGGAKNKSQRAPFNIAAAPRVELAFVWKNLLSTTSYLHPRAIVIAAVVIAVVCTWLTNSDYEVVRRIVSISAIILAIYIGIFGPLVARQDLRKDLANADVLKTYPLRGWQIVLGEIVTPVFVVSALLWLVVLTSSIVLDAGRLSWLTTDVRVLGAIAIAAFVPFYCATQVLVLNAATVVFPAWMENMRGQAQGIDVLGQRLLFLAALLITLVGALLPAAVVGGVVFATTYWIGIGAIGGVLAYFAFIAMLGVEIGLGIAWLGNRFERLDLSAELRP